MIAGRVAARYIEAMGREGPMLTLFHGTVSAFEAAIRREGIVGDDAPVSLATTEREAADWAQMRADNMEWRKLSPGHLIVIKVKVPKASVRPGDPGHYKSDVPIRPDQIVSIRKV